MRFLLFLLLPVLAFAQGSAPPKMSGLLDGSPLTSASAGQVVTRGTDSQWHATTPSTGSTYGFSGGLTATGTNVKLNTHAGGVGFSFAGSTAQNIGFDSDGNLLIYDILGSGLTSGTDGTLTLTGNIGTVFNFDGVTGDVDIYGTALNFNGSPIGGGTTYTGGTFIAVTGSTINSTITSGTGITTGTDGAINLNLGATNTWIAPIKISGTNAGLFNSADASRIVSDGGGGWSMYDSSGNVFDFAFGSISLNGSALGFFSLTNSGTNYFLNDQAGNKLYFGGASGAPSLKVLSTNSADGGFTFKTTNGNNLAISGSTSTTPVTMTLTGTFVSGTFGGTTVFTGTQTGLNESGGTITSGTYNTSTFSGAISGTVPSIALTSTGGGMTFASGTGGTVLSSSGAFTISATNTSIATSLTPSSNNTYNLGASGKIWSNLYIQTILPNAIAPSSGSYYIGDGIYWMKSSSYFGWGPNSSYGSNDTILSRGAVGVVSFDSSTSGDHLGSLIAKSGTFSGALTLTGTAQRGTGVLVSGSARISTPGLSGTTAIILVQDTQGAATVFPETLIVPQASKTSGGAGGFSVLSTTGTSTSTFDWIIVSGS